VNRQAHRRAWGICNGDTLRTSLNATSGRPWPGLEVDRRGRL